MSETRVTVLDPAGPSQDIQHLNQHINYTNLHTDAGANHAAINAQIQHSLATPLQPTISSDGNTIYIPAFGFVEDRCVHAHPSSRILRSRPTSIPPRRAPTT